MWLRKGGIAGGIESKSPSRRDKDILRSVMLHFTQQRRLSPTDLQS